MPKPSSEPRWGGRVSTAQMEALRVISEHTQPSSAGLIRCAINLMAKRWKEKGIEGLSEFLAAPEVQTGYLK